MFDPIGEESVSAAFKDTLMCAVRAIRYGMRILGRHVEFSADQLAKGLCEASKKLKYLETNNFSQESVCVWAAHQEIPLLLVYSKDKPDQTYSYNGDTTYEIITIGTDSHKAEELLGVWLQRAEQHWYTIIPSNHKPLVHGVTTKKKHTFYTQNPSVSFSEVLNNCLERFNILSHGKSQFSFNTIIKL